MREIQMIFDGRDIFEYLRCRLVTAEEQFDQQVNAQSQNLRTATAFDYLDLILAYTGQIMSASQLNNYVSLEHLVEKSDFTSAFDYIDTDINRHFVFINDNIAYLIDVSKMLVDRIMQALVAHPYHSPYVRQLIMSTHPDAVFDVVEITRVDEYSETIEVFIRIKDKTDALISQTDNVHTVNPWHRMHS